MTGTFVVTAVGAFYALRGTTASRRGCTLRTAPSSAWSPRCSWRFQPAMRRPRSSRGIRSRARGDGGTLRDWPDGGDHADRTAERQERRLDNPIGMPGMLSFLAYGTFHADVRGPRCVSPDTWPTNIELLYYAFHVMAGLGTIFIGLMALAVLQRLRGRLESSRRCCGC